MVPAGRAAKAASVGAKTVKGPSPLKSSARPAAMTAVSRVVWSGLFTMMSTTVVVGGAGGRRTASMTCTTPLSARMSATVTVALLIITEPPMMETVTFAPLRVVISWPSESDVLRASPPTTWYVRMALSNSASARTASMVPAGSASNAASVGAKTVNGPSPLNAPARPAARTAASKVVWSGLLTMMSTTVAGSCPPATTMEPTMPCWAWLPKEQS